MIEERRDVPARALILSVFSLSAPVAGSFFFYEWATEEYGLLIWMTALVPAFLLTYYRGWRGASVALAGGMAALSVSQVGALAVGVGSPDWGFLPVIVVLYIGICFGTGFLAELLHRERRTAKRMALTDPLTGLPNRRHTDIFLSLAVPATARGTPLSVVIFDLDHFKRINDGYGHGVGDQVLQSFADVLRGQTRRSNLSARWGGEEFLCVLSDCDKEGALAFAERVRAELRALDHPFGPVTASAGIAVYRSAMGSADVLVAAADQALYAAKEGGRNRSVVAGDEGSEEEPTSALSAGAGAGRDQARATAGVGDHGTGEAKGAARILLVDDDDAVRDALARMLRRLGHEVLEAGDSESALKIVENEAAWLDVLVTDIILPDLNGFSLVQRISRFRKHLPVLYISGQLHGEVSWSGVPGSVTSFLEKPVEMDDLAAKLSEVLGVSHELGHANRPSEIPSTQSASV